MTINTIKIYLIVCLTSTICMVNAQDKSVPNSFLQELNSDIGVWVADNSLYQNENEPYDSYALEWKFGIGKKSVIGRLYVLKNGIDLGSLWEFRKFWDSKKGKAIVVQYGSDGSFGIGEITIVNERESKLLQTFTNTDGSQYKRGHITINLDSTSHIGNSYSVNAKDQWTQSRSYTWVKKMTIPSSNTTLNDLSFLEGKWKATSSDSTFSSVLEYRYSPKNRLLLATNHLYSKDGKLFAEYEGAYLLEVDSLVYFIAGPHGETHRGYAMINEKIVTHFAHLYPGKDLKSYKSEMALREGKLFYYANYSKGLDYPKEIDYSNPLVYSKISNNSH